MKTTRKLFSVLALSLLASSVMAAASPEEAAKLGTTLTPLGAEKAGNADGSIPAWQGGLTKAPPGPMLGDIPVELFPGEQPLFRVDAANMAAFDALLSDGTR